MPAICASMAASEVTAGWSAGQTAEGAGTDGMSRHASAGVFTATAIWTGNVVEPSPSAAVTVYAAGAEVAMGVPWITPFELRVNPYGSAGLTDHLVTVPVTVGTSGAMGTPKVAAIAA
jgi:hypothetical protein